MAVYVPKVWVLGEVIIKADMDHLETQYASAVAEIDPATKEFNIPVAYDLQLGGGGGIAGASFGPLLTAGQLVHFNEFKVPHDFTALTSCVILVRKNTNGNVDWTVTTDFSADNELYNTHSDSDTADGVAMVEAKRYEIDCSDAFTGLAVGDMVGMKFTLDVISAGNLAVLGATFRYS